MFAPSLVIGSGVGLAFGMFLHLLPLDGVAEDAAFALAGMAGMVAGVMHGPLTGIFLGNGINTRIFNDIATYADCKQCYGCKFVF